MEWMTLYTYKSELVFAKIILSNLVIAGNIIDIFEKKTFYFRPEFEAKIQKFVKIFYHHFVGLQNVCQIR